jgi:hypothetical protein
MKYFLILFALSIPFSLKADISNIPQQDIEEIKSLFERLIDTYDFGYTIFGSKPMSLADMCLKIPPHLSFHKHLKAKVLLAKSKRRIYAWYKHRNEFHFKDFIFLDKEEDTPDCFVFILINKKNMLDVLYEHELVFKQELGSSFTPEIFLEKIEKGEVSLAKATNDSHKLLGIMLGYGERNATLFQDRFDLSRTLSKRNQDHLPLDSVLSIQLNFIEAQLGDFSEFEEEPVIPPLYFLADVSHPETIELKKRYDKDRQKIEEMKKKPNFMDCVLQRLLE